MIAEGTEAPGFTLPGTAGEEIEVYHLDDLIERGPTILAFYPFDFSPVCADQLCTFRDLELLTFDAGVDVVGISPDSAYSHKQFIAEYELNFPLLCDRFGTIAGEYGLRMEEFEHHKAIPKRGIVTVDSSGSIRSTWEAESQYQAPSLETIQELVRWYRNPD